MGDHSPSKYSNAERNEQIKASIFFKKKMDAGARDLPRYNHLMAALAVAGRDNEAAKSLYQNVVRLTPGNVAARGDYALHLNRMGKTSEAVDEFKKAILLDRENPHTLKNYGAMLGKTGKSREALTHTTRSLQLAPHDAQTHRNMAALNANLGDTFTALKHNFESIRLEPPVIPAFDQPRPRHHQETSAYRAAAVQIISVGGKKEEAHLLMDVARKIEGKKIALSTTERTNELLQMMLQRRGDTEFALKKEAEEAEAKKKQHDAVMASTNMKDLLGSLLGRTGERPKLGEKAKEEESPVQEEKKAKKHKHKHKKKEM